MAEESQSTSSIQGTSRSNREYHNTARNKRQLKMENIHSEVNNLLTAQIFLDSFHEKSKESSDEDDDVVLVEYTQEVNCSLKVNKSDKIHIDNSEVPTYKMNSKHRGLLFLINIMDFGHLGPRKGSEIDAIYMIHLFREMGFYVFFYKNLRKEEFHQILDELLVSEYCFRTECFVMCIMSHGGIENNTDKVMFFEGGVENVKSIIKKLKDNEAVSLAGKPKVLIFPFCRHNVVQTDSLENWKNHPYSDILICYGSVPGFVTYRDPEYGSWYIQTFCTVLAEHAHNTDIEKLLKIIGNKIKLLNTNEEKQIPANENYGFFKMLYFNPGYWTEDNNKDVPDLSSCRNNLTPEVEPSDNSDNRNLSSFNSSSDINSFESQLSTSSYSQSPGNDFCEGGNHSVKIGAILQNRYRVECDGTSKFGYYTEYNCTDIQKEIIVTLMIFRLKFNQLAARIIKLFKLVNNIDYHIGKHSIQQLLDHFERPCGFETHICLIFEFLSNNVLSILRNPCYESIRMKDVKMTIRNLLKGLDFLHTYCKVAHCDITPENIFRNDNYEQEETILNDFPVKITNFNSVLWVDENAFKVRSNNIYQSIEMILNLECNTSTDIWSIACVAFELATGVPLFNDEHPGYREHIMKIMQLLGPVPEHILLHSGYFRILFNVTDETNIPIQNRSSLIDILINKHNWTLNKAEEFTDFLTPMLHYDPKRRPTAADCLNHTWIKSLSLYTQLNKSVSNTYSESTNSSEDEYNLDEYFEASKYYEVEVNQILNERYEIIKINKWTDISNLCECLDLHCNKNVSLEILQSDLNIHDIAEDVIKFSKLVSQIDSSHPGQNNIVKLLDNFEMNDGQNIGLIFELLGDTSSLITLLNSPDFRGMPIQNVKNIIKQILQGLDYLYTECKVINYKICPKRVFIWDDKSIEIKKDIFTTECDFQVKIANFCYIWWDDKCNNLDQYSALEDILGAESDFGANIWRIACIAFELATGKNLFEPYPMNNLSRDEHHLALIYQLLGPIPEDILSRGINPIISINMSQEPLNLRNLLIDKYNWSEKDASEFSDFLQPMLQYNPGKRATASTCLNHIWLQTSKSQPITEDTNILTKENQPEPIYENLSSAKELLRISPSYDSINTGKEGFPSLNVLNKFSKLKLTFLEYEEEQFNYYETFDNIVNIDDCFRNRYRVVSKKYQSTKICNKWICWDKVKRCYVVLVVVKSPPKFSERATNVIQFCKAITKMDPLHSGRIFHEQMIDSFEINGVNGTHMCLVFQFLGDNLSKILQKHFTAIPIPNVKTIIRHVLMGLEYLHARGITHRFIRPEFIHVWNDWRKEIKKNIFDECDIQLKIASQSRVCWIENHSKTRLQCYKPLEIILGKNCDTSADIWSTACMAYELATGKCLFDLYSIPNHNKEEYHIALIIQLLGPIPKHMSSRAIYLRKKRKFSLKERLIEKHKWNPEDAEEFSEFLKPMLEYDSTKRATAEDCLNHAWLKT